MIFINYRKEDTQAVADHLAFRLREHFGTAEVFKDDSDLKGGDRWPDRLYEELLHRRVVVALLGRQWLLCRDQNGQPRLADPADWVRRELCTALELGKCVLLLLVDEAPMPTVANLPEGPLRDLCTLQAMPLRPGHDFESDLTRLIGRLGQLLAAGAASSPGGGASSNLPISTDSFVGRERESRELVDLLTESSKTTLVTLCGPPGTGKTRLAIEVGRELLSRFPGGCWFADLAETRSASDIARAVAEAFGVPLMGTMPPIDGVSSFLEYRRPLLILLDNFEQVVEHASVTIGIWRRKAPQVSLLVTSRALLGLAGEREYHLGPLTTPPEGASCPKAHEVGAYASVRLFVDRARQVQPHFALDEQNAHAVGGICARLDGIPLAIEMAAARVRILQPAQILGRLSLGLDDLRSSRRDVHRRHQTLLAAIQWSYSLLEPWEQEGFLQASIFRAGFFLEAAEAVLDLSAYPDAPQVLDLVQGLCEKNLIKTEDSVYGTRFRMLASIREYSAAQLAATRGAEAQEALWNRFVEFYRSYAETWNALIHSPFCRESLDRLQSEIDNCFAAHSRSLQAKDAIPASRIILALGEVLSRRGSSQERIQRLKACLDALGPDQAELDCELKFSVVETLDDIGDWESGLRIAAEAVEQSEALGAHPLLARLLVVRSHLLSRRGDYLRAIEGFRQAEAIWSRHPNLYWLTRTYYLLGWACAPAGEDGMAQECYDKADALAEAIGDPISLAATANNRGVFLYERWRLPEASACFVRAEQIDLKLGDRRTYAGPLSNRGMTLLKQLRYQEALACFNEAESINQEFGNLYWLAANLNNRAACYRGLAQHGDAIADYQAAEALNLKMGNRPWLAKNLNLRGLVYVDMEKFELAAVCFSEAEEINTSIGALQERAYNIGNRGRVLARLGDSERALTCIAEAETINRSTGNRVELAENLGNRGRTLLDMERLHEAREVLRQSLQLYEELGSKSLYRFEFTSMLAFTEGLLGNPAEAGRYANEAMQLAEELNLTDEHQATWFARLLPRVRSLLTVRGTVREPAVRPERDAASS